MYSIARQSGQESAYVMHLVVDTRADITTLPVSPDCAVGSTCACIADSSRWMLGNDNKWHEVSASCCGGGGGSGSGGGDTFYPEDWQFATKPDIDKMF